MRSQQQLQHDHTVRAWGHLHSQGRHRLRYPSEHVVRFLSSLDLVGAAVDIGCGAGRHVRLLQDFNPVSIDACDASYTAANFTRMATGCHKAIQADMTDLPYADSTFDTAIAYGVFYYGTRLQHHQAIEELYRVLKRGGHAFVQVRGSGDWRAAHTRDGRLNMPGEPEHGMLIDFINERDLVELYQPFTNLQVGYQLTSTNRRDRVNSDWLITVTK